MSLAPYEFGRLTSSSSSGSEDERASVCDGEEFRDVDLVEGEPPKNSAKSEEPRVGHLRLLALSGYWGVRAAWYAGVQVLLLPDQVSILTRDVPAIRDLMLGLTTVFAAVISVVGFPYFGLLSDRSHVRRRWRVLPRSRRVHFVLIGLFLRYLALVALAPLVLPWVWLLPVLVFVVSADQSLDAVSSAPYMAMLPDVVPKRQWGTASGWIGLSVMIGNTLGAGLLGIFFEAWHVAVHAATGSDADSLTGGLALNSGISVSYALFAVAFTVGTVATVFGAPPAAARVESHPDADDLGIVRAYALWNPRFIWAFLGHMVEPMRDAPFRWVFFTRFLFTLGFQTIITFFKYFVDDTRNCECLDPPACHSVVESACSLFGATIVSNELAVGLFVVTVSLGSVTSVLFSGVISDYLGRKPVISAAGVIMFVNIAVIMLTHSMYLMLVSGFLFGVGYGGYISVDYALIADVLPTSGDAACDMGIWHASWSLPALLAPLVGGVMLTAIRTINDELAYIVVFSISAICVLLGALLVYFIRNPSEGVLEEKIEDKIEDKIEEKIEETIEQEIEDKIEDKIEDEIEDNIEEENVQKGEELTE